MNLLNKLKTWQKLTLIAVMSGLAIPIVLFLYINEKNKKIKFSQYELEGIEYLIPLQLTFELVADHRGLANAVLHGDSALRSELNATRTKADKAFEELARVDAKYDADLDTSEEFNEIRSTWEQLRDRTLSLSAQDSLDQHQELAERMMLHFRFVSDHSNLTLDPELETFYLGDAVVVQIPQLTEDLDLLRDLGVGILEDKVKTAEDNVRMIILEDNVKKDIEHLDRDLEIAFSEDPELSPLITPVLAKAKKEIGDFLSLVDNDIIGSSEIVADPINFFNVATTAIHDMDELALVIDNKMKDLIEARVATFKTQRLIALIGVFLAIIISLISVYLISKGIITQVNSITDTFGNIGLGDYDARCTVTSQDEIGEMANNLNLMLDNTLSLIQSQDEKELIQESIMKLLEEISGVADGDLTGKAVVTEEITGAIADSFNFMIDELRNVIGSVVDTTLHVSSSANEVQTTTEHLAKGSESQSEQILSTSAAIEEMAVSIQQVSENAALSANVAEDALNNAKLGGMTVTKTMEGMASIRNQVQETSKRIKRLGESSQEVGEIVKLIGDIADRTSILALNASIQAAMAGEAGRGFAVVAEEVERLAERATDATKQISTIINTIQTETNEAVTAMEDTTQEVIKGSEFSQEAGKSLSQIESVSNQLAELIQSISTASKQQARGSESIAESMGEISNITQQSAAGTRQAAVSIRTLAEMADNLRDSVQRFRLPKKAA